MIVKFGLKTLGRKADNECKNWSRNGRNEVSNVKKMVVSRCITNVKNNSSIIFESCIECVVSVRTEDENFLSLLLRPKKIANN